MELLRTLCGEASTAENHAAEIRALQEAVIDLVRQQAGDDVLPMDKIVKIGRKYLSVTRPQINEAGLQGLMRYIIWYSWHEGYLQW
jgi:hypothetical protein